MTEANNDMEPRIYAVEYRTVSIRRDTQLNAIPPGLLFYDAVHINRLRILYIAWTANLMTYPSDSKKKKKKRNVTITRHVCHAKLYANVLWQLSVH